MFNNQIIIFVQNLIGINTKDNYKQNLSTYDYYTSMLVGTMFGLVLTNPLDVVACKLVTQQYEKYTGFRNCLYTVIKEESLLKLMFGGLWARFAFYAINGTIILHGYKPVNVMFQRAFEA